MNQDEAKEVSQIVKACLRLINQKKDSAIQGTAIAGLAAMYISCFHRDDQEDILDHFTDATKKLLKQYNRIRAENKGVRQ
jgi:hypothetical protein